MGATDSVGVFHQMYRAARTAQTFFPRLIDAKYAGQTLIRRVRKRPFEPEFGLLEHIEIPTDAHFLDVGANQGQSVQAIRFFCPTDQIDSFEANPIVADKLGRRLANDPNTAIHACGLGDQDDRQPLFVPEYRGYTFDGLASLSRDRAQSWLNKASIMRFRDDLLTIHELDCHIRKLDDFDFTPFFVKINVQGWEREVIDGGRRTIERSKPILLIEAPDDLVLVPQLKSMGYTNYAYHDGRLCEGHPEYYRRIFVHGDNAEVVRHLIEFSA